MLVAVFQHRHEHHIFQTVDFSIDVVGAGLAALIAVTFKRPWAATLAAFQILGALNWLMPLLDPAILHRASVTTSYIWEAGALSSLAAGAASVLFRFKYCRAVGLQPLTMRLHAYLQR